MAEGTTVELYTQTVILLSGAVIAAPLFKRIGLGTVLGYLAAGVILGPILSIVTNGKAILHFAELGVVFLLFIVGLEMKPSRLWAMRKDILGLGTLQVMSCGIVLTLLVWALMVSRLNVAIVIGFGLALSSTAFALQLLQSRGEEKTAYGRKTFSILLFQDLAIIPMLAILPLFAYKVDEGADWTAFLLGMSAIAIVILAGRYLLNPFLTILARTGAQEVMIAAALLVVFGSAMLMHSVGLSMALGSFLAGVLLAESSFKHELEANIDPFRGILLGLFFMAVGLSLDVESFLNQWPMIMAVVILSIGVKALLIYFSCRIFSSSRNDSIQVAAMLSQNGEFGFVLFAAAASGLILGVNNYSFLVAVIILSMALTPFVVWLGEKLISFLEVEEAMEEDFEGAGSPVLLIGFSRMGQVVSQTLLASGTDVTVIDNNPSVIRQASRFGFRIYFGNGARKEVLHAAGIGQCKMVCVCTHSPEVTNKIIDVIASEYPDIPIYARAYDRAHTLQLMERPVHFHTRETFESALVLGEKMLLGLGKIPEEAHAVIEEIRQRDHERLIEQHHKGIYAGTDKMHTRPVQPEPLVKPAHDAEALDERSRDLVEEERHGKDAAE